MHLLRTFPETVADIPGAEDMDRYQVFGIVDPREFKIINLDIRIHPEMTGEPWTGDVTEPEFEKQFHRIVSGGNKPVPGRQDRCRLPKPRSLQLGLPTA